MAEQMVLNESLMHEDARAHLKQLIADECEINHAQAIDILHSLGDVHAVLNCYLTNNLLQDHQIEEIVGIPEAQHPPPPYGEPGSR